MSDRRAIAFHEAGHAVAYLRMERACAVVSIVPRGTAMGTTGVADSPLTFAQLLDANGLLAADRDEVEKDILCLLAGFAASVRYDFSQVEAARSGAASDFDKAGELIAMLQEPAEIEEYIVQARTFVDQNWPAIRAVAEELLKRETLAGEEIDWLVMYADGMISKQQLDPVLQASRGRIVTREIHCQAPGCHKRATWCGIWKTPERAAWAFYHVCDAHREEIARGEA